MQPGRHEMLDDREFLREWGFLVEAAGRLAVTRGALLLFGKGRHIRRFLPRPVVDFQIIHERYDDWSSDRRWDDRIVVEDNIIQSWLAVVDRYMKPRIGPFDIDTATLRRHDEPPDYISFREAAINLLIHQDYGEYGTPCPDPDLPGPDPFLEPRRCFRVDRAAPGAWRQGVRNPTIVAAFRRIGLSDQAGTGIRAIFGTGVNLATSCRRWLTARPTSPSNSPSCGKAPQRQPKTFPEELGVSLNEQGAALLAHACIHGRVSLTDTKAITGLSSANARQELEHLVVNVLLKSLKPGLLYALADQIRERYIQSEETANANHKLRLESRLESRPSRGQSRGWSQTCKPEF